MKITEEDREREGGEREKDQKDNRKAEKEEK